MTKLVKRMKSASPSLLYRLGQADYANRGKHIAVVRTNSGRKIVHKEESE